MVSVHVRHDALLGSSLLVGHFAGSLRRLCVSGSEVVVVQERTGDVAEMVGEIATIHLRLRRRMPARRTVVSRQPAPTHTVRPRVRFLSAPPASCAPVQPC